GDTGRAIVEHPDIDKLAFTGSTEVGKWIAKSVGQAPRLPRVEQASRLLAPGAGEDARATAHRRDACATHAFKRLTLELGGKAAHLVFEDAPIDQAVEGVISGIFFNQGHVCCAGSRLLVQESIFPKMLHKLRDRI